MRDVTVLAGTAETCSLPLRLLPAVHQSNELHKNWPCRRLDELLAPLAGKRIGVLGLTYKPGTDTLRRSSSLEACRWLTSQGALVRAYDPAVARLPDEAADVQVCSSAKSALLAADAILVATPWPAFRELSADNLADWAKPAVLVVDPAAFLAERLSATAHPLHHGREGRMTAKQDLIGRAS